MVCPEDRYSICGRICQHALGGPNGVDMQIASWNANGMRGTNLELEHFINQHGVAISFSSETFLSPGQAFQLDNDVCRRTDLAEALPS